MNQPTDIFHFEDNRPSFEDLGIPNGVTHWAEDVLMTALGYESLESFNKAVLRAKQTCLTLGMHTEDHFVRRDGGWIYTRFACYLIAMNGDPRKPATASAQAYFAAIAETFQQKLDPNAIDRVLIREEIVDGQKSLASTAKSHGVSNYGFFQNAGYMGMYNMSLGRLCELKGVKDGTKLVDRMGKEEMAAHLFRITQTDAKIKKDDIRGQRALEDTAKHVGKQVRGMMVQNTGTAPEQLPLEEDINSVKKGIKGTGKKLQNLDSKKKPKGSGEQAD